MEITQQIQNIRDQKDLTRTPKEKHSGELLSRAAEKILAQKEFRDFGPTTVGVEAEFLLVDDQLNPVSEIVRDSVIHSANNISEMRGGLWSFQHEMGASQIEANQEMKAILGEGFHPQEMVNLFKSMDRNLVDAAHVNKVRVLGLGLHPTASLSNVNRTSKPKYQMVPNHHMKNRTKESNILMNELNTMNEPDSTAVGLSQALQFNIKAESQTQAVNMMNWMIQMAPSMLAITANDGLSEGRVNGWVDPRNRIWNQTHMTESGSRVMFPESGFFGGVEDVFKHMAKFPLILEPQTEADALAISTGTNWLASKLKFITNPDTIDIKKILVEFRPMSIQQTPEANAAATMLGLGRLFWSMINNEPLLSFKDVENNSMEAMKNGLNGKFVIKENINGVWGDRIVNGKELRNIELNRAIEGLVSKGHGTMFELEGFFAANLPEREPSRILLEKLENEGGIKNRVVMKDTLIKILTDTGALR